MVTSPKSKDAQEDLNKRLRSLKIDRGAAPAPVAGNRTPKLLFLGIAVLLALVALGYVFLFSSATTISVAPVRVESGGASLGESVLSASGYVVAHHKIAVGAKVMGRVAWIGVEKGDRVQDGQVLVRLEDSEFRAQVNQAQANLAAAQARLDRLRTGSRPEEKLKDKAAVLQAEANLKNAEAEYQRTESLYRSGVASKSELKRDD
jgi:multidrug efflux pump subunit AcrA (membrane-fusion protein)